MTSTKLTQAITLIMSGATLAGISSAEAATTSYNTFNHDRPAPNVLVSTGSNGTDGWMRTSANGCNGGAGSSCGEGPATWNNPNLVLPNGNAAVQWVGNDPRSTQDFNYAGTQTLNWTAVIDAGETATISRLDSNAHYAGTLLADGSIFDFADIDTAQGAWHDGKSTGWKHDTDIGLFKSSVTQQIHLSIGSLLNGTQLDETPDYGFTVFKGMDTTTANYGHHGGWHGWDPATAAGVGDNAYQLTDPNPLTGGSGSGLETFVLDDVSGNDATFIAEAGEIYTIMLGGFQGGGWISTRNDYQLTISAASPVPLPNAAWLFGSAILGLLGSKRHKKSLN